MSTLNFGTIMKMIFDDKSDIIFAKQNNSGMSKDRTEYSNGLNGLDILCRFVMISKTKLRRGIMLRNIFFGMTIFLFILLKLCGLRVVYLKG